MHLNILTSTVVHVYGSPYSMGLAQGKMLKDEINKIIPAFFQHVEDEVENEITFLPKELQELIAKYGLDGALDITYELTKKYIPKYFLEELQGVADGAGIDYKLILRVHMLPELVKVSPFSLYSNVAEWLRESISYFPPGWLLHAGCLGKCIERSIRNGSSTCIRSQLSE